MINNMRYVRYKAAIRNEEVNELLVGTTNGMLVVYDGVMLSQNQIIEANARNTTIIMIPSTVFSVPTISSNTILNRKI